MPGDLRSPWILQLSWGRLEVESLGTFKDAKLYPGGGREWDWRETGTRHVPGIQPADVAELLDHGAEVVVLSKGVLERLQVCRGGRPPVQRARGDAEGRRPVLLDLLKRVPL
jgi:hypothetical protein